ELRLDALHPLAVTGLVESAPAAAPDTLRAWRASARLISFLEGQSEVCPLLRRAGGPVLLPEGATFDHASEARALIERVLGSGDDVIMCVEGLDGVGRRTLIAEVAARVAGTQGARAIELAAAGGEADASPRPSQAFAVDAGRLSPDRPRFLAEL